MGNACVAGGGCPHKIDIVIINNTKYKLELDQEQKCGRECQCSGYIVNEGKIVEGSEPPKLIESYGRGTFSASGREGTAVAPKGKIFYCNVDVNLHVIFEWCNAGWTSREEATADAIITGAKKAKVVGSATPWTEIFEVKVNSDSWIYTLQEKGGKVDQALDAVKDLSKSVSKFKVI